MSFRTLAASAAGQFGPVPTVYVRKHTSELEPKRVAAGPRANLHDPVSGTGGDQAVTVPPDAKYGIPCVY